MPAINDRDNYGIFNANTGTLIETHGLKERAEHFCEVMNKHEEENGRAPVYKVAWRLPESMWEVL